MSESVWPTILLDSIFKATGIQYSLVDLFYLGPKKLIYIGKCLGNRFWKVILTDAVHFLEGAVFCHHEKIIYSSFWNNPLVTRYNKSIREKDFPILVPKIFTLCDFFKPDTGVYLTREDLNIRLGKILITIYILK